MNLKNTTSQDYTKSRFSLRKGLGLAFSPLPLPLVNFLLARLVRAISHNRPEVSDAFRGITINNFLSMPRTFLL